MTRIPVNDLQLEVLEWVRHGASEDVYADYRPRIVARALHRHGLLMVSGRGQNWHAEPTDDGVYYLQHGDYPPTTAKMHRVICLNDF